MEKASYLTMKKGAHDGIPIALGYLSVSFAFGLLSVEKGLPGWSPIIISLTNFTGTGQFAGMELIAALASVAEIAFTILIINLRYLLMSLSLSQRLSPSVGLLGRLAIAFGITDEIFAVAIAQESVLNARYMGGLILMSFSGWVGGTCLGVLAGGLLPASVQSALGIALYGMFIAIIIPPARTSRPITLVLIISIIMSSLFYFIPLFSFLSSGWVIIICGVVSAAVCAWLFPVKAAEDDQAGSGREKEAQK